MKKFFRGPVKELTVSNIKLLNNSYVCKKETRIIKDNELFYENFFGKIIRKKDRYPMILENELHDIIDYYGEKNLNGFSAEYINPDDLKPVKVSNPKSLIKKNNPKK